QDLTIDPTEGPFQAALSNGPTDVGDCSLTPLRCFSFSGNLSTTNSLALDSELGVPYGSLFTFVGSLPFTVGGSAPRNFFGNGSAIGQSFFGNAGDVLSFTASFLTYDGYGVDGAVIALDGTILGLLSANCCTSPVTGPLILPTTGMHHLGFAVFNGVGD